MDDPVFNIPDLTASGRIRQLFANANLDAADLHHGALPADIRAAPNVVEDGTLIFKLIQQNKDLYNKFLNNRFCKGMAYGTLPSSTYDEFAKQDYLYLLDDVKFKALRFSKLNSRTSFSFLQVQADKIASAVKYAGEWKQTCIDDLGIPPAAMGDIEPSAAEIGYASFLRSETALDDYLSLYIITIPCVYGWGQIAKMLDQDPKTDKSSSFYKTWIQPNLDEQYGKQLSQFIEANRPLYASTVNDVEWNDLFRTALKFEIGLFDSVLAQAPGS
ncbi:hypothetical protein B0T26DRAFT_868878 [Lasiosphaeria miniovina]|uniref:Thiaminase-2/PQQC domain-containing protein n=1 Tax=Lasiosphaeria miniovina TaxID=1954250 RepID=A0AA40E590_9PEZI|nr:uncharacterized protein B0T26DRAFT_868878 [Lasiosphaeria miniovina]KAK0727625.1 hypothetical protein B0T26DRAFT_868878 [Lasiosphaeria miniovina]